MALKIFLTTLGSRGDFEPFLAFAVRAKTVGHDVALACTTEFAEASQAAGITTFVLPGSLQSLVQDSGVSPLRAWKDFGAVIKPMMVSALESAADAIIQWKPDVVLYHPKVLSAPIAASKIDAVAIIVEIVPLISPTREFGAAGVGTGNYGLFNKLTYLLVAQSGKLFEKELSALSQRLNVERSTPDYSVCLVSPSLISRPSDWPDTTFLVGPWTGSGKQSAAEKQVVDFVKSKPTILAGFGSMKMGDPEHRSSVVAQIIREAGYQALIVTGWGGMAPIQGEGIMSIQETNYDHVLPLVHAVIHHGGAGTIHAALRAGKPAVIVPFIADQPWWASRLHKLGLGPRAIPEKSLSLKKLKKAIHSIEQFSGPVNLVSRRMATEDGIQQTLDLLHSVVKSKKS